MLGLRREEILGKELWQIGLIESESSSDRVFRELEQKGMVLLKDVPLRIEAGGERIVDIVANRYLEDGQEVIQCNIRDLTERKQAELELKRAKNELERANRTLEQRVKERTEELEALNGHLRELSSRLINAQEDERTRIAQELHDEIGQALTAIKLQVRELKERPSGSALEELETILSDLMRRVQQLSLDLHPHVLDDLGLKAALEWHFTNFENLTHIKVRFDHAEIPKEALNPRTEITLFRLIQEGLTNIAKHADASEAAVRLFARDQTVHLEIHDSGKGFRADLRGPHPTLGLSGMEERVMLAGGTFHIESKPGEGTHIYVTVPFSGRS